MASPRRKSCLNCVKGKRRCDATVPQCQRCASRGLVCEYLDPSGPLPNLSPENENSNFTVFASLMDDNFEMMDSTNLNPGMDLLPFIPEQDLDWSELQNTGDMEGYVNTAPGPMESGDDYVTTCAIYQSRVLFASRQFKTYPGIFTGMVRLLSYIGICMMRTSPLY